MESIEEMAEQLKLLADKTRLTILALLKERELCVCDIVEALDISQPNASQHLRKLKASGFVTETRRGQWVYYALSGNLKPYVQDVLAHAPSMEEKVLQFNRVCD